MVAQEREDATIKLSPRAQWALLCTCMGTLCNNDVILSKGCASNNANMLIKVLCYPVEKVCRLWSRDAIWDASVTLTGCHFPCKLQTRPTLLFISASCQLSTSVTSSQTSRPTLQPVPLSSTTGWETRKFCLYCVFHVWRNITTSNVTLASCASARGQGIVGHATPTKVDRALKMLCKF